MICNITEKVKCVNKLEWYGYRNSRAMHSTHTSVIYTHVVICDYIVYNTCFAVTMQTVVRVLSRFYLLEFSYILDLVLRRDQANIIPIQCKIF